MSFTFNGINCETMGLFVERFPERPFPSRKQNIYQIHGRSGDLIVDENAFSNVAQTYEVFIKGGSQGFQAKATAIAYWLLSPNGYAELTDTYDPTIFRKARFTGGVSFLNALNKYGKATISFDCCPQRYPVTEEVLTGNLGATMTVPNTANLMGGLPLIDVLTTFSSPSLTVDTNSLSISIPVFSINQHLYIDFETHTITQNGTAVSATVSGSWNPVESGEQIITTSNTSTGTITIKTRRWYL